MPDKPLDHPVFQPDRAAQVCQPTSAAGQQMLGHNVLEKNKD
jgi:hypothetical protein